MKTLLRKWLSTLIVFGLLTSALVTMPAFGAASKTVEVKGYIEEGMTKVEISKKPAQFSVSNVTGSFDAKKVDASINAGLIAASPAKITLLENNMPIFDVYRLTKVAATMYSYDTDKTLPISGKVNVFVPDESGEYVEKTINASELKNYEVDMPYYQKGCTVTLTEPGDYLIVARREAEAGSAMAIVNIPYKQLTFDKKSCVYDSKLKTYFVPAKTVASLLKGSFTMSKGSATIKTALDTMTFKVGAKTININTYDLELKTINGKLIKNELYVPVNIVDYLGCKAVVK